MASRPERIPAGEPHREFEVIEPRAYLKSMAAIAWNSFRHPFSTTLVDLTTGQATNIPANR